MRTATPQAIEADLDLLWRYESEGLKQSDLAVQEGQCQQRISVRLARARRIRCEIQLREQRSSVSGQVGGSDLPYLALTDDPSQERGEWYDLRTDDASLDSGKARIGTRNGSHLRVHSLTAGEQHDGDGPTSYKPTPGLKGGVG